LAPEQVAVVIADAIASESTQLRWPIGQQVERALAARSAMPDEQFLDMLRSQLDLKW
jgi:hypothetical protein